MNASGSLIVLILIALGIGLFVYEMTKTVPAEDHFCDPDALGPCCCLDSRLCD